MLKEDVRSQSCHQQFDEKDLKTEKGRHIWNLHLVEYVSTESTVQWMFVPDRADSAV